MSSIEPWKVEKPKLTSVPGAAVADAATLKLASPLVLSGAKRLRSRMLPVLMAEISTPLPRTSSSSARFVPCLAVVIALMLAFCGVLVSVAGTFHEMT